MRFQISLALGACLVVSAPASLVSVGPFGTAQEKFEGSVTLVGHPTSAYLPGIDATLAITDSGDGIGEGAYLTLYDNDKDTPTANFGLGAPGRWAGTRDTTALGVESNTLAITATFSFNEPVKSFGGYFQSAMFSADQSRWPIEVDFLKDGKSILSAFENAEFVPSTQSDDLVWQGWSFSDGSSFDTVVMSSSYLAMDDLRVATSPVPEPATLAALATGVLGLARRRRR